MSDQEITAVLSSDFLDHSQIKNIYQICPNFRELMSQQITNEPSDTERATELRDDHAAHGID